jgi:hypothetical protein
MVYLYIMSSYHNRLHEENLLIKFMGLDFGFNFGGIHLVLNLLVSKIFIYFLLKKILS